MSELSKSDLELEETNMSKSTHTREHAATKAKTEGCCGHSHAEDEKAQPGEQPQAHPAATPKREHHADSGACGCGSGKAKR